MTKQLYLMKLHVETCFFVMGKVCRSYLDSTNLYQSELKMSLFFKSAISVMICQHYLNVNGAESPPPPARAGLVWCLFFFFYVSFLRPISNFSITMETERTGVISHKWCLNKLTTLKEKPVENSSFGARWGLQEIQVIIFYCSL